MVRDSSSLFQRLCCVLWISNVFLLVVARKESVDNENNPYHHVVNMDSEQSRYLLEWTVDWAARRVTFQVTVQTNGFIIFGLSRRGELPGADLVIGGVDSRTGAPYLEDMHGSLEGYPEIQRDRSLDYELLSAAENITHTRVQFSRAFDTCDTSQDHRINDDKVEILWGFGQNDYYNNVDHQQLHGTYRTYLLDPDWTPRGIQEAKRTGNELTSRELGDMKIWTVTRRQRVPAQDTTYWCSMHKGPVLNKRHHLVGFEFRWDDPIAFKHTHHLLVYRCTPPTGVDPREFFHPFVQNNTGEACYLLSRDPSQLRGSLPAAYCAEVMYVYGIGGRQFFFPEEMGMPFGDSPNEYYFLQVHYDNPLSLSNLEFEINIDMYYTPNLRPQEAGLMTVGHQLPGSPSILVPPNSPNHNIYGHCGDTCTQRMLPPEGINIVGVVQHTHNSGIRFRFQHFRGNMELPWIANDDNYDNTFQSVRMKRNEVRVLPGDQLFTRCVYDSTWTNGSSVAGGLSTRQEMCLVYIWYANKIDYLQCRSEITDVRYSQKHLGVTNWTWSEPALDYVVADEGPLEGLSVVQVSDRRRWTRRRRQELELDQLRMPFENFCVTTTSLRTGTSGATQAPLSSYPTGIREYVPVEVGPNCRRGEGRPS